MLDKYKCGCKLLYIHQGMWPENIEIMLQVCNGHKPLLKDTPSTRSLEKFVSELEPIDRYFITDEKQHTVGCLLYKDKTGYNYCIAECKDSRWKD